MVKSFRVKSSELVIAGLIFFVIMAAMPSWFYYWRTGTNPDTFFEVRQIYIPDMQTGDNPEILYDSLIKSNFHSRWHSEIQLINGSTFKPVCDGFGETDYSPQKQISSPVRLDWLVGALCHLMPGKYRVETVWTLSVPGYPALHVSVVSNVFEVK